MMLLHSTASSSTFEAHPCHPQRLPNLNLMVSTPPRNLMVSQHASVDGEDAPLNAAKLPTVLCINNFPLYHSDFILIQFRLQETDEIPTSWLFCWCRCCCHGQALLCPST